MAAVKKIGRSKVVAPHPEEIIGVSPAAEEVKKHPSGLRTRKATAEVKPSPQDGALGSTNLAAVVIRSFQKEKQLQERRQSISKLRSSKEMHGDDIGDEGTPKLVEVPHKPLPELPQKMPARSVSRGKESKEDSSSCKSDEKREPRRSVSAQPSRERRQREPFDCSARIAPSVGAYRGVAKAFLKNASSARAERKMLDVEPSKPYKQEMVELQHVETSAAAVVAAEKEPVVLSSLLQERLALLEDKVALLASELKDTKELLHAGNPTTNKILQDIQVRLAGIEKSISASKALDERRTSLSPLENAELDARRLSDASGPGHKALEDRVLPHLALLKSRPSLEQVIREKRAALQQKVMENRTQLRAKIAALEGHELPNPEVEVIAEEFLASLEQPVHQAAKAEDSVVKGSPGNVQRPSSDCSARKNSCERKRKITELVPSTSLHSTGSGEADAGCGLECDESMLSEDAENIAPTGIEVAVDMEPKLTSLGSKVAMAGWYVYDGEGILLANEDGSCSYFDVANMEEKSQYKSPESIAPATWRDCWLVRAAGPDGRANKYVVAASAGSAVEPAFCSWNFYEKTIAAYHSESPSWPVTPTGLTSSVDNSDMELPLWWYKPCGPLVASAGSGGTALALYDVRDGDFVMKWESNRRIASMEFSCPIQWRSKTALLVAEDQAMSLWDVSNLEAVRLHSIRLADKQQIRALHIYNSDAECSGGVRQRISSKETGGIDGVFATQEAVHALDFRVPSGIAVKIPVSGHKVQSLYVHGDAIYAGTTGLKIQLWSLSMSKPMLSYDIPAVGGAKRHESQLQLSQVWGSKDAVMGVNGNGLFIFESPTAACSVIGSDDLYSPSFDYSCSKVLLISRDRPASWQYWP